MSSDLVPYQFPGTGHNIRVIERDGEPWFIAGDVALALGYRDAWTATRMLTEAEKGTHPVRTPGHQQEVTIVSEAGLYRMVMRSNKEKAVEFQLWIAHDVLPSIRKTGSYVVPRQKSNAELHLESAQIFLEHEQRMDRIESNVDQVAARVDSIEQRTGWIAALAFAKLNKLPTDTVSLQRLGSLTARQMRAKGQTPHKVRNDLYGTVNMYPEEALAEAARTLYASA